MKYKTCPKCSAMYDWNPRLSNCLSCKVPLRPSTEKEVRDFERYA